MAIVVERVNRNGQVLQTDVIDKDSCTIGRGFDCDVILHDEHVDAQQLEIKLDSVTHNLICEDKSTTNGVWLLQRWKKGLTFKQKTRLTRPRLFYSGQGFVVGRTFLRIYASNHQISPTVKLSSWEVVDHILGRWYVSFVALLCLVGVGLYNNYLSSPQWDHLLKSATGLGSLILGCLIFASVCAFVGRLLRHDAKFFVYVSLALFAVTVSLLIDLFLPILSFNTGLWRSIDLISSLLSFAIIFGVIYLTLFFATQLGPVLRLVVSSVLPVALLLAMIVKMVDGPDFRSRPDYNHGLVAPRWQFAEPRSVDTFLEDAMGVYAEAEQDAAELLKKSK